MEITLLFELSGVIGLSVLAHAVIAYVLAPRKAKQAILDSIVQDTNFQNQLVAALIAASSRKMKFKDETGEEMLKSPIDILGGILSDRFMVSFRGYVGGKQTELIKDMEDNAQTSMASSPDNPLLALAMTQIPKKYLPYIQIVSNLLQQNQNQK